MLTTQSITDPFNNPSRVDIGKDNDNLFPLPQDVIVVIDGEKVIAESKILDGVMLFERVSRKPFDIDFNFTVRGVQYEIPSNGFVSGLVNTLKNNFTTDSNNPFPQHAINGYMSKIWNLDQVLKVKNTLLNGIGIDELIIKKITLTPVRGSTSVLGTIKALENYHDNNIGATLLVQP